MPILTPNAFLRLPKPLKLLVPIHAPRHRRKACKRKEPWRTPLMRRKQRRPAMTDPTPRHAAQTDPRDRLFGAKSRTPHPGQTRQRAAYSVTWPHSMLACSLVKSVLLSASRKPIRASVLIIAGRLNITSSVVVTSPALVVVSSHTVHCITPAVLVVRHQSGRSARDGQVGCPRFLTLPDEPYKSIQLYNDRF